MPETTITTAEQPVSLQVTLHASSVPSVEVTTISDGGADDRHVVYAQFGTIDTGVTILGPLTDVYRLVIEADRKLAKLIREQS